LDFSAHTDVPIGSDRTFGIVLASLFLIIALYPAVFGAGGVRYWALFISLGFASLSFIRPTSLHAANLLWIKLGTLLGKITSPVILAAVFFIIVTPIAIVARRARYNIMSTLAEFWRFLIRRKKYWLMPIFLVLAVFGVLIVMTQGSAISPLIYTMF